MPNGKEEQYSIEARSLGVVGVASHNFLVLRDGEGRALAELHGLATDRKTDEFIPIGTDEQKHSLRIWHFAHDAEYAKSVGAKANDASFIQKGQSHETMLTAGKEEVLERWNAAVAAKQPLNALDLNYPSLGFRMSGDTVNSNAAYRTLSEIMGVPVHDFPWKLEPGLDNRMVDQKEIQRLRTHEYPVLDEPSIKVDGQYKPLGKHRAEAERAVVEPAVREQQGQFDARDPSHHGHADYARIRQQLASSIDDPQKLDNVSASAYREMVANPLVKQADYVGIHDGHAVVSYAPFGLGREPMFNAHIELAKAQDQPAEQSLGQAQRLSETHAQVAAQQQSQALELSGPALSIGARST
jgi:hypothetical protein